MGCCNCNRKDLIKIIKKYNFLIRLSEKLFEKSEELLDKIAKRQIIMALKTLRNAIRVYNQARESKDVAEKTLRKDICGNLCSRSNDNCKDLRDSANEQFDISGEYIDRAMCSLKNALNMINKSIEAKEKGCILEARYEKCVRNSNNMNSSNDTNCENDTDFLRYIDYLSSTEILTNLDNLNDTDILSSTDIDTLNAQNILNCKDNTNTLSNNDCFNIEEELN